MGMAATLERTGGVAARENSSRAHARFHVTVLGVYALIAAGLLGHALLHPASQLAGGHLDAPQFVWFLGWTPNAVAHLQNPLITDRIAAPGSVNLAWTTFIPILGILAWPLTATIGVVAAYNLIFFATLVGAGAAAYWMLLRLLRHRLAAAIGGGLYAFSPFMVAHAPGHPDVIAGAALLPLGVILLDRLLRGPTQARRDGLLLGALCLALFLTMEELLLQGVIVVGVGLAYLAATRRQEVVPTARRLVRLIPWASLAFLPVALPYMAFQFLGPGRPAGRLFDPETYSLDLLNLVVPADGQALSSGGTSRITASYLGNTTEWSGYIGGALLLLLVLTTLRHRKDLLVRVAAITLCAAALLSLGPHLHVGGRVTAVPMPWILVSRLPLFEDVVTARFTVFMFLAAAVLVAVAVRDLGRARAGRGVRWGAILVAATLVTLLPRSLEASPVQQPAYFTESGASQQLPRDSVALVLPLPTVADSLPMLWQAESGYRFRMVAGYATGLDSRGEDGSAIVASLVDVAEGHPRPLTADEKHRLRDSIGAHGIDEIVAVPSPDHPEVTAQIELLSALLGPPAEIDGVQLWRDASARARAVTGP
jgi:hypothetical protein